MSSALDSAALVALIRLDRRPWREYTALVERPGDPIAVLERELAESADQISLLPGDPEPLMREAEADIAAWRARGFRLVTILDSGYPRNLHAVHDRPPLIFVAGQLKAGDFRSVAVIGARRASDAGLASAADVSRHLVSSRYVVVSGLAAGVDTAAHTSVLAAGGRTIAVLGTGLAHAYPPENAALQRRIGAEGALVSQFWPDSPPTRRSFPMRNAVMSGMTLGTVVVEASARSGARVQARLALAHGRPVFLMPSVLGQMWARELAGRAGVHVVADAAEITTTIERLYATDALVE
jgi:DNA processing protein